MICDICGEEIQGDYYELPDGMTVCADSDCLEEWAQHYARLNEVDA